MYKVEIPNEKQNGTKQQKTPAHAQPISIPMKIS